MKLKTERGYIEIRELGQYEIGYDAYRFRHDCMCRGALHTTMSLPCQIPAGELAKTWAALHEWREYSAASLLNMLGDADLSEASAPDMPHGYQNPKWLTQ